MVQKGAIAISLDKMGEMIEGIKDEGHFFTVVFAKRSDGSIRRMTCRGGVKKYTKGVGLAFEPSKKNLVGVWETNNADGAKEENAYRFISKEGLKELHYAGNIYLVA